MLGTIAVFILLPLSNGALPQCLSPLSCSYGCFVSKVRLLAVMSRAAVLWLACCVLALSCLSPATSAVDIPSSVVPRHLAPPFNATAVINQTFTRIALSDYLTEGHWVVLLF